MVIWKASEGNGGVNKDEYNNTARRARAVGFVAEIRSSAFPGDLSKPRLPTGAYCVEARRRKMLDIA